MRFIEDIISGQGHHGIKAQVLVYFCALIVIGKPPPAITTELRIFYTKKTF